MPSKLLLLGALAALQNASLTQAWDFGWTALRDWCLLFTYGSTVLMPFCFVLAQTLQL